MEKWQIQGALPKSAAISFHFVLTAPILITPLFSAGRAGSQDPQHMQCRNWTVPKLRGLLGLRELLFPYAVSSSGQPKEATWICTTEITGASLSSPGRAFTLGKGVRILPFWAWITSSLPPVVKCPCPHSALPLLLHWSAVASCFIQLSAWTQCRQDLCDTSTFVTASIH